MSLIKIAKAAFEQKQGFTYSHLVETPKTGFFVAIKGHEVSLKPDRKQEFLIAASNYMFEDKVDLLNEEDNFFGCWFEKEKDRFVFDVSKHIEDKEQAIQFGKANSQRAIWDIANNIEIHL
jgi:hypothetical protein